MECKVRRWRIWDAASLAEAVNNKNVLDNLRDGIPYPYTEDDARAFIMAMLNADDDTGALGCSVRIIFMQEQQSWVIISQIAFGEKGLEQVQ